MLRKRRHRTQDDVAVALDMKRSTVSGYENGVAQPGIEALVAFSAYYQVAIDTLIKTDLSQLAESQVTQLERGHDVFIRGSQLRVLTTTVDAANQENIELVTEKAKAGYRTGFADPEYISVLPAFHLPFLSRQRKYRTFQISGDSMLPIPDKAYVTGEFVLDWSTIRNRHAYIILTINDGVVFKVAENRIEPDGLLVLHSLNPLYEAYSIHVNDIREVWKFVNYISPELPEARPETETLLETVKSLKREIQAIQMKLNL
ncbi:MAG: LexA family transcriptional regulator [Bacteroidales bacterium]|nr:LexA family transcriptional regulator [Bacteroidales bacterium]MDD3665234.1 LexA family transcriptional regulator [Bacteroidales bacterium]